LDALTIFEMELDLPRGYYLDGLRYFVQVERKPVSDNPTLEEVPHRKQGDQSPQVA